MEANSDQSRSVYASILTRIGEAELRIGDTKRRFLSAIRTGDPNQQNLAFAITVAGAFAGYTLLNRYAPETNYSHWHITNPRLRGSGLSTALYPHRIKMYFELLPLDRLIHQTRTHNVAVNRMLNRYVPVAETVHVERPDGVALPGEFHLRYVFRRDIPEFFKKAEASARFDLSRLDGR